MNNCSVVVSYSAAPSSSVALPARQLSPAMQIWNFIIHFSSSEIEYYHSQWTQKYLHSGARYVTIHSASTTIRITLPSRGGGIGQIMNFILKDCIILICVNPCIVEALTVHLHLSKARRLQNGGESPPPCSVCMLSKLNLQRRVNYLTNLCMML